MEGIYRKRFLSRRVIEILDGDSLSENSMQVVTLNLDPLGRILDWSMYPFRREEAGVEFVGSLILQRMQKPRFDSGDFGENR